MKCQGDVASNWDFFKRQWSDYEIATGLDKRDESVRLATLRSAMGRECLQILPNLSLSEEDKKKIDKCLEALENYFKPTRNVEYERYVFNTCLQSSEESVQTYVARLRKLAASCEYGALTDEFIRDRLVIGLKSHGDKVMLLRKKTLTLQKAIEMCTSSETASKQMKTIEATGDKQTEDVKKFRDKKTGDDNRRRRKMDQNPLTKRRKTGRRIPKVLPNRHASIVVVKNVMQKEQSVPRLRKRATSVRRRAISRPCAAHRKKCNNSKKTKKALMKVLMKVACKWKLSPWYRLKQSSGLQMSISSHQLKEDFTTTLSCQLDTGAICNVLCLDDLSIYTVRGSTHGQFLC